MDCCCHISSDGTQCPTRLPAGYVFCATHGTTQFDRLYVIIDNKVYRRSDKALIVILWHHPCDNSLFYNSRIIQACLEGKGTVVIKGEIIHLQMPDTIQSYIRAKIDPTVINTPNSIEFIPPYTYYNLFHEYSGPSTGYSVVKFDPREWEYSLDAATNKKFKRLNVDKK